MTIVMVGKYGNAVSSSISSGMRMIILKPKNIFLKIPGDGLIILLNKKEILKNEF